MKKLIILIIAFTLYLVPNAHAYTITGAGTVNIYNQTTSSVGQMELFDYGSTWVEYLYHDLGINSTDGSTIRLVFSEDITTNELPEVITTGGNVFTITTQLYNSSNVLLHTDVALYSRVRSFSYFETNFMSPSTNDLDYIIIRIDNLPPDWFLMNDVQLNYLFSKAIIVIGNYQIINQTITTTQYNSGWHDAMNSKVTQIWSLWGNIFDTFMGVFNVFSVKLMGDITIGHLALVPLVLGLIGFIYALGGKRGR